MSVLSNFDFLLQWWPLPIMHSLCICPWLPSLPVLLGHLLPFPSRSFNPAKWVSSCLKCFMFSCFLIKSPGLSVKLHMAFLGILQGPVAITTLAVSFKAFCGCSNRRLTQLIFAVFFFFSMCLFHYSREVAVCLKLGLETSIHPSQRVRQSRHLLNSV